MSDDEELPPSKLGTKEHWDMVYDRENRVFEDVGDEGEVWFGESAVDKMRAWAHTNLPAHQAGSDPLRILECGSGNGTLLLSFLTSPGPDPQSFHLTGIDYSAGATKLGASIEASRREQLEDEDELDEDDVLNEVTCEWRQGDLLRDDLGETWDLVMDKGTFDALALSQEPVAESGDRLPSRVYPERVARLVRPGGFFLITSCNFTEEEIKKRYTAPGVPFTFHSSVPHRSFSFGGKTGTTVCTVAFTKNQDAPATATTSDPLYACVDCGGTKTEVVIASEKGILARALGGTGNMAEVGLQQSFKTIVATALSALESLGFKEEPHANGTANGHSGVSSVCPVQFADIWVGISGCDTPLDQANMSALLSPFFRRPVAVYNDALLLGGGLLQANARWGIAVIAGTGSIAVGVELDSNGELVQSARRGGHGYLLGDDGSAYDVGRCAVRAAVHAFDAGEETSGGVAAHLRAHFGVENTGELLAKVHDLDNTLPPIEACNKQKLRISSASRGVLEAFTQSPPDPLAATAVADAIAPLAASVVFLAKQLVSKSPLGDRPRSLSDAVLVCGGGVIRQDAYRAVFLDVCAAQGVVFGNGVVVVQDVAGTAALGLVQRAKGVGL